MPSETSNVSTVRVGQVWRDNDKRSRHRQCVIVEVDATHATVRWMAGNQTRIRLDRFRPNSTGYVLLGEA